MFIMRSNVSLRSSNAGVLSCIASVNNRRTFHFLGQSTTNELETIVNNDNNPNITALFHAINFLNPFKRHSTYFANNKSSSCAFQVQSMRTCATDSAPKKVNVFGELSDRQFENYEMDEDEKKEEKFVENEARVLRRFRLSPGRYADLIKQHIQKGDLNGALGVLDTVAENRDKPTAYMYNLLLRAFAVVGDLKKSRSLYTTMKKRGLKCNAATYTSIINACGNYHHSETALEYLGQLRQEFAEKNIPLNDTHYNAMIKVYGRHNRILDAFVIADEMRDKHLPTSDITFNSLLIGTISDRESGLRHALVVWHLMRQHRIKPTVITYNLLLRAIRDTKLGELKVNDVLISTEPRCQIYLNDGVKPDLLNDLPTVNSLVMGVLTPKKDEIVDENQSLPITITTDNLPVMVDSNSVETRLTNVQTRLLNTPLETIRKRNQLILFGGITGILERMQQHGVTPDTKTITLLMELVPNTGSSEMSIVKTARAKGVKLDIDFWNMLMKKRSFRMDYDGAKEILDDIQRSGLCPDIITWGILALGCRTSEDARNLVDGMRAMGHQLNVVIAGTLINNACRHIRFGYILEVMEMMVQYNIKPNWELYTTLDNFQKSMVEKIKSKKFTRTVNHPAFKMGFSKFNLRYSTWQQHMERKMNDKSKKS